MYPRKSARIDHIRSKSVTSDEVSSTRVATNSMTLGQSSSGILTFSSDMGTANKEPRIVALPSWIDGKEKSQVTMFKNSQYLNRVKTGTDASGNDQFDPNKGINYNNLSPPPTDPSGSQVGMVDPNGYQLSINNSVNIDGNLFLGEYDTQKYIYKSAILQDVHFRGYKDQTDTSYNNIINAESRIFMEPGRQFKLCIQNSLPLKDSNGLFTGEFSPTVNPPNPIALEDSSDDRLKHNEVEIKNARDTLDKLKALMYDKTYNFLPADFKGPLDPVKTPYVREAGFIAQDVEKIPELKHIVTKGSETVPYYLKYTGIVPFLVRASQEMSAELKSMQQIQAALLARIEALESNN